MGEAAVAAATAEATGSVCRDESQYHMAHSGAVRWSGGWREAGGEHVIWRRAPRPVLSTLFLPLVARTISARNCTCERGETVQLVRASCGGEEAGADKRRPPRSSQRLNDAKQRGRIGTAGVHGVGGGGQLTPC